MHTNTSHLSSVVDVRVTVCAGDLLPVRLADLSLGRSLAVLRAAVVVAMVGEQGQPHSGLAQQLLHVLRQVVHEPFIWECWNV